MQPRPKISKAQKITLLVFVLVFLVPSSFGFLDKLYMFVKTVRSTDEGSFALIPVMNYLLVFLGMFSLLIWAIWHGMFRDVEGPKYTMLDNERRLDEEEGLTWD